MAAEPFQPFASLSGSEFAGDLGLLEVRTGESVLLPGVTGVRRAAFSPEGDVLALDTSGAVRIIDLDGATVRDLSIQTGRQLDGPNAWSPDGALLTMTASYSECGADVPGLDEEEWVRCMNSRIDNVTFVDATGRGAQVPEAVPDGSAGTGPILGWMGDREVLVLQGTPDAGAQDQNPYWLTALPLDGEPRRLSALPGSDNYGIGGFQLASGLVPQMSVDPAGGRVDRGPWPVLPAMTVSLLAAAVAMALTERVRSRWARRHRRA